MNLAPETVTALLLFMSASVIPALLVRWARGDVTDPRVVFPLLYFVLTSGPALWVALGGEFYVGIEVDQLPHVFTVCTGAVLAFVAGASIAIRGRATAPPPRVEAPDLRVPRWVALVALTGLLLAYGYASLSLKGSSTAALKAETLYRGDPLALRLYYLLSAACFVAGTLVVVLDSAVRRGRVSVEMAAIFLLYAGLQAWNDEREISLIVVGWLVMNARHQRRRMLIAVGLGTAIFVAGVAFLRAGSNLDDRLRLAEGGSTGDVVEALLTKSSSNLFVLSKISVWVPEREPLRYGATYVDAVLSFTPGAPSRGLSDWFKDRYARGSTSGYGFAMDAEAYLNFGWIGPALVFALWGAGLGVLYQRTRRATATWFSHFLWILMLTYSAFAIRADSRALLKILVYGIVSGAAVALVAAILQRRVAPHR